MQWGFAVGAVGARLSRAWIMIGIIPNLSNYLFINMSLYSSVDFMYKMRTLSGLKHNAFYTGPWLHHLQ